jgi:SAM-dependent MidA family methyltransferase
MTDLLELQGPVSKHQSIRMKIATSTWEWGAGSFFTEHIPFSARNGHTFAQKLVDTFKLQVALSSNNHPTYFVYELGGGLGLLSKFFLDILKRDQPILYEKTKVIITDNCKNTINRLKKTNTFTTHKKNINLKIMDAINPIFKKDEKPFFVYSSHLIDSFKARQIELNPDSNISEILTKTDINKYASILDTSVYPPKLIDADSIKKIMRGSDNKKKLLLAPKLLPYLHKKQTNVAIGESSEWTEEEKNVLHDFTKHQSPEQTTCFNYSLAATKHISNVLEALDDNGIYLITDFGLTKKIGNATPKFLVAEYGTAAFYSVCFPLLIHQSQKVKAHCFVTKQQLDQTQELLIYKGKKATKIEDHFHQNYKNIGYSHLSDTIEAITKLSPQSSSNYIEEINALIATLSKNDRKDYFYLKTIATQLLSDTSEKKFLAITQDFIENYEDLAFDAYLLLGWYHQKNNDHKIAITNFQNAINICPNSSMSHSAKGLSNLYLNNFKECIIDMKKAIEFSRSNDIWQTINAISIALEKMGNITEAQKLFNWALEINKVNPSLIPLDLIIKFTQKTTKELA